MCELPRRRADEWVTLYAVEPSLRDVFVEGPTDRWFYGWFLGECGCAGVAVYDADCVELPPDALAVVRLRPGKRQSVVALAHMLHASEAPASCFTCVIDRDFDLFTDSHYELPCLLVTDYRDLEMYFFNEAAMSRCLAIALRRGTASAGEVMAQLAAVLQEVYLVRLTNTRLGWGMDLVDRFTKFCSLEGGAIRFDSDSFVNRSLNKSSRVSQEHEFRMELQSCRSLLTGDVRQQMRGRDLVELLAWYFRQHRWGKRPNIGAEDHAADLLFSCADVQYLRNESLFAALIERVQH